LCRFCAYLASPLAHFPLRLVRMLQLPRWFCQHLGVLILLGIEVMFPAIGGYPMTQDNSPTRRDLVKLLAGGTVAALAVPALPNILNAVCVQAHRNLTVTKWGPIFAPEQRLNREAMQGNRRR